MWEKLVKAGVSEVSKRANKTQKFRERFESMDTNTLLRMFKKADFSEKNLAIGIILKERGYVLKSGEWEKE